MCIAGLKLLFPDANIPIPTVYIISPYEMDTKRYEKLSTAYNILTYSEGGNVLLKMLYDVMFNNVSIPTLAGWLMCKDEFSNSTIRIIKSFKRIVSSKLKNDEVVPNHIMTLYTWVGDIERIVPKNLDYIVKEISRSNMLNEDSTLAVAGKYAIRKIRKYVESEMVKAISMDNQGIYCNFLDLVYIDSNRRGD